MNGGGVFVAILDDITGKGEPVAVALAIILHVKTIRKNGPYRSQIGNLFRES